MISQICKLNPQCPKQLPRDELAGKTQIHADELNSLVGTNFFVNQFWSTPSRLRRLPIGVTS
jgi:hypothetical protein